MFVYACAPVYVQLKIYTHTHIFIFFNKNNSDHKYIKNSPKFVYKNIII